MEVSVKIPSFFLRPDLITALAKITQEPCVIAGTAKLKGIKPGDFVKIQKFILSFDPGILRLGWQHPAYIAGNPGRVKVPQNTDPFVALLNIKVTQIFKAFNGLSDTGVA